LRCAFEDRRMEHGDFQVPQPCAARDGYLEDSLWLLQAEAVTGGN